MCTELLSAMTPLFGFETPQCYKATVNELETITDTKAALAMRALGSACPGWTCVERS
jgi:hypothetical protein